MHKSKMLLTGSILFCLLPVSNSIAQTPESDFAIMQGCLGLPATDLCANADLDADGVIGTADLLKFYDSVKGDFNKDNVVDVRDTAGNPDYEYLQLCTNHATHLDCSVADLNGDGVVDLGDESVFFSYAASDIHADGYVYLTFTIAPLFQNLNNLKTNEQEKLSLYIWALSPWSTTETITYTLQNVPVRARVTSVIMGDLNADGVVNDGDVAALDKLDPGEFVPEFDLDNNRVIDQFDRGLLMNFLGKQVTGLHLLWQPKGRDSGIFNMQATATSSSGLQSIRGFRVTVLDVQALNNYYDYDDVLVVINDQSPDSQTIGNYFVNTRQVPLTNVVHISTPAAETIARSAFETDIRQPIEQFITAGGLEKINYIVTTKGVPLRIAASAAGVADNASVDSELTLIRGPYAHLIGDPHAVINPYYQMNYPFSREMTGVYLVTRLTAYTAAEAIALIERSQQAVTAGSFVLDIDPTKDALAGFRVGNHWMRNAAALLGNSGQQVLLDETTTFLSGQVGVLGYSSWGSNDSNSVNNGRPSFTWAPRSIAETYVSTSARTFTAPAVYGQSLIADLIAEGVSGVKGYVFEPHLVAMARPDALFDRYTRGFTLADAFYGASSHLGWQDVVVGDPKMAVRQSLSGL